MKKFLAVVMSFAMLLSVFAFSGCGKDSVFDGKFKQVTLKELQTTFNDIGTKKTIDLDNWKVSSYSTIKRNKTLQPSSNDSFTKKDCTYLFNTVDGNLIMQGEYVSDRTVKAGEESIKLDNFSVNYYYKDNALYYKKSSSSGDVKVTEKMSNVSGLELLRVLDIYKISFDTFQPTGYSVMHDSLRDFILDDADEAEDYYTFYISKTDDYIKLKITAKSETDEGTVDGSYIMVYDAKTYAFVAGQMYVKIVDTKYNTEDVQGTTIEPTEEKVNIEEDFSSYTETDFYNSDWEFIRVDI